ncbi:MAG: SH3 domain-containing protein [Peptococcaceae bacterium]|nr:SH3 domain-containing protein [Peptococcaceae bacterium]
MNKKLTIICFLTFLIGCAGGGALAYANHQKGLEAQSLLASISQTQNDWEVEQFIREQEEQRPDGLEEAQIVTGSRYTGITYNNVAVASASQGANSTEHKMDNSQKLQTNDTVATEKVVGRVNIQSGSLNIRETGNIDGKVIGQAYKDELLEIIAQEGVWYQIATVDGKIGYVSSTYVEIE